MAQGKEVFAVAEGKKVLAVARGMKVLAIAQCKKVLAMAQCKSISYTWFYASAEAKRYVKRLILKPNLPTQPQWKKKKLGDK